MAMTKRDFERVATILRMEATDAKSQMENGIFSEHRMSGFEAYETVRRIANSFATIAEQSNSRFDNEKFMAACGFQKEN